MTITLNKNLLNSLWFLFLSFFSVLPAAQAESLEEDYVWLNALEDTSDGTMGEKRIFDFIAQRLDDLSIPYRRQSLGNLRSGHSFSQNILATIDGFANDDSDSDGGFNVDARAGQNKIVLVTPVDSSAYSIATILKLAEEIRKSIQYSDRIVIVFLGAEKGSDRPYGSYAAVNAPELSDSKMVIYLESALLPQQWLIRLGAYGKLSPYWLTRSFIQALEALKFNYQIRGTDLEIARSGMQGEVGAAGVWINSETPAVSLRGLSYPQSDHFSQANAGDLFAVSDSRHLVESSKQVLNLILALNETAGKELRPVNEQNYIFIRPFEQMKPRLISELPYITFILLLAGILASVILLQFRRIFLNLKRFQSYWWTWPLLMAIMFLFLFLSSLIIEQLTLTLKFPAIWKYMPDIFFFLKMVLATILSFNFITSVSSIHLPNHPNFYSYTAFITSFLLLFVLTGISITLAFYALWSILCIAGMISIRNINLKALLLLASIIPQIIGLTLLIKENYIEVIQFILLDRIAGNLLLTIMLFPLITGTISIQNRRLSAHKWNITIPAVNTLLFLSLALGLSWIFNTKVFNEDNLQPVELIDYFDLPRGERRIEMRSIAPMNNVTVSVENETFELSNLGRSAELRAPIRDTPIDVEQSSKTSLGKRTVSITVSGDSTPQKLEVFLKSEEPFTLHAANFPFEVSSSGSSAWIFIGRNPPFPLNLRFTVNDDARLTLGFKAGWSDPEPAPLIRIDHADVNIQRRVYYEIESGG